MQHIALSAVVSLTQKQEKWKKVAQRRQITHTYINKIHFIAAPTFDSASVLLFPFLAHWPSSVQRQAFKRLFVSSTLLPIDAHPLSTALLVLLFFCLANIVKDSAVPHISLWHFFELLPSVRYLLEFVLNFPSQQSCAPLVGCALS